ncbi:MAG: tRNA lysidine(34) synthetase TilS [Limisphaerales bacterium]
MHELLNRLESNILDRGLLKGGDAVLVAVSGGLDSMVLLYGLHELASKHKWQLLVGHFNHQLRGRSSDADERLVSRTAKGLGLEVVVERGNVLAVARQDKISVEMSARKLRHNALSKIARERGCSTIALAHHADDQLELLFLRLQRGAGGEGLGGMKWVAPSPVMPEIRLIRPLLAESKESLGAFAALRNIPFREDASNASKDFLRNRIRHEIIPVLKAQKPPIFETALRSLEIIGAEADFVAQAARQWWKEKKGEFEGLHMALQRRILHDQLREYGLPVEFELLERLRSAAGDRFAVGTGVAVSRDQNGRIQIHGRSPREFTAESLQLTISGRGRCTFGNLQVSWSIHRHTKGLLPRLSQTEFFDADQVGKNVVLRYWQPGDRFHPIGMKGESKLQDLFVNFKIAAADRRSRVVAVAPDRGIFWVEGLRISEKFKLTEETGRKLKWVWKSA